MNLRLIALSSLMIISLAGNLSATEKASTDRSEYSTAQIKKMAREAHTVEQYTVLADYYATRHRMFKRKAAEEMHIWAERNAVITPLSEKWPRPVDSARNLYDYFEFKAGEAAELQAKYSRLADDAAARQSSIHDSEKE